MLRTLDNVPIAIGEEKDGTYSRFSLSFDQFPYNTLSHSDARKATFLLADSPAYRRIRVPTPSGRWITYSGRTFLTGGLIGITTLNCIKLPDQIDWRTALFKPPVQKLPRRSVAIAFLCFSCFIVTIPLCLMVAYVQLREAARLYNLQIARVKSYSDAQKKFMTSRCLRLSNDELRETNMPLLLLNSSIKSCMQSLSIEKKEIVSKQQNTSLLSASITASHSRTNSNNNDIAIATSNALSNSTSKPLNSSAVMDYILKYEEEEPNISNLGENSFLDGFYQETFGCNNPGLNNAVSAIDGHNHNNKSLLFGQVVYPKTALLGITKSATEVEINDKSSATSDINRTIDYLLPSTPHSSVESTLLITSEQRINGPEAMVNSILGSEGDLRPTINGLLTVTGSGKKVVTKGQRTGKRNDGSQDAIVSIISQNPIQSTSSSPTSSLSSQPNISNNKMKLTLPKIPIKIIASTKQQLVDHKITDFLLNFETEAAQSRTEKQSTDDYSSSEDLEIVDTITIKSQIRH